MQGILSAYLFQYSLNALCFFFFQYSEVTYILQISLLSYRIIINQA